ncbi:MAG: GNAT family N-acetyltransferase [Cypionkella sp.]|nr:GNAT family N-acetyltransferase [Cypionkella sp.]
MLSFRRRPSIETERMTLRLPGHSDYRHWAALREASVAHLTPWEPVWSHDHLSRKAFTNRVYWAGRAQSQGTALPLLLIRREDQVLLGAVTLDHIRRGPVQAGTIGYWIGQPFARRGYMREAVLAVVHHAFNTLDLSRIESACLPENVASRGVLEKSGFKYEGVAQSYLQINGRWRNHVLYAALAPASVQPIN